MRRTPARSSRLPLFAFAVFAAVAAVGGFYLYQGSTVPAPYVGAPYYSRAFVREMHRQPGNWVTPHGTQLRLPDTFHGRWFNTMNGQRLTLGQPAAPAHTLWLLGGSAVYNAEVPDAFTFASQLQNFINKRGGGWRVENLGMPGATSAQEVERLKTLQLKPDDMVVFFDGATDAAQPLAVEAMVSNFGNALDEAARYSHAHGARFVQVLQPMLFAQPQLSDYEKTIPPQPALTAGYTQLRAALPQLAAHSGWEYADLSELLNGPDEYYLNCCTSNERGGALIAGYLFDFLFKPRNPTS